MGRHATIGALADAMRVNDRSARTVLARLEHAGWVEVMRLRRPAWVRLAPAGEVLLLTRSAAAFTAAMAAQGIHVGIGSPPLCAVCDVPYPCAEVRPDTLACDSDGQQATTVSTVTGTTDG